MDNRINILGVPIDKVDMEGALKMVDSFLVQDDLKTIYTPNSEIMMEAQLDRELKEILMEGSLVVPDGAGVVLAAKILGFRLPGRLAGYDLVEAMLERYAPSDTRVYLLGAKAETITAAAIYLVGKYKGIKICGYHHGYFEDGDKIIEMVNSTNPDILLVGLGAPKQEKWIHKNKDLIRAKVAMGVGGSFDGFAGTFPRAPEFFREKNLEWLYRLYKEPRRFFRMLNIPKFLFLVIKKRLFNR